MKIKRNRHIFRFLSHFTFLISNTEAYGGAGRVLGDLLRDWEQLVARFRLLPAQSDSGDLDVDVNLPTETSEKMHPGPIGNWLGRH